MTLVVALLETVPRPLYQRMARNAVHLHQLGLSHAAIAKQLGVAEKTVAKGIARLRRITR